MKSTLPVAIVWIVLFVYSLALTHEKSLEDSLTPYTTKHGSTLSHEAIHKCHREQFGILPSERQPARIPSNSSEPFIKVKRFVKEIIISSTRQTVRGHYVVVSDPMRTLSVVEPNGFGGCSNNTRQTVVETAKTHKCLAAINAGYFDTKHGNCLGNVISDEQLVHDSNGIQNVHFGLTKDGNIFTGYLSHEQVLSKNMNQLVGGVVWILRNGSGFVNISKTLECEDTEETGPMDRFSTVRSARTAVGHDKDGNVVLVQVDGKTDVDGLNLYEMESLLQKLGLINAINLDGGGSSTLVLDGVTANYPYDQCEEDKIFNCDRKVSTILCVHSPYCDPKDCSNHGKCVSGSCLCEDNWLPPLCDRLFCGQTNCSNNGVCYPDGCVCNPGHYGKECNETCPKGFYGSMCSKMCDCLNSHGCNSTTGLCFCKSGFTGEKCDIPCSTGYFGANCKLQCQCESSCYCDPFSGACGAQNTSAYEAAECLAKEIIVKDDLVKNNPGEKKKWIITMAILGTTTSICVACFLLTLCCSCSCTCKNDQVLCFRTRKQYKKYRLPMPGGYISDSMSDNETLPMKTYPKS